MCLSLIITLPEEKQKNAKKIADKASTDKLIVFEEKRWFKKRSRFLFISKENRGCACDLLTDDADWDAETWDIIESYLPDLSLIISSLSEEIPEGFIFEALWAGDVQKGKLLVTAEELSKIIRSNKIKIKITYQVIPPDPLKSAVR